jgi:predicted metalloendopeptidase
MLLMNSLTLIVQSYPDKWIDYTNLDIQKDDSFLAMIFKSRAFEHAREVKEMNAPTDRDKWVRWRFSSSCSSVPSERID